MFIPTNDACPEWTSDDAGILRDFVASSTGTKLFQTLAYMAPELLDGEHVNKTLVASGVVRGYTLAIESLLNLRTSRPKEAEPISENYPSIDDDAKWTDSEPTNSL